MTKRSFLILAPFAIAFGLASAQADSGITGLNSNGMKNNISFHLFENGSGHDRDQLVRQLKSGTAAERTCAATDLGFVRTYRRELLPVLVSALKYDESKWVRRAAAKALGRLGLRDAIPPLTEALRDSDHWVAHSATNALVSLKRTSF